MNMHQKITPDSTGRINALAPPPDDFVERAQNGTNASLKAHYGVGERAIQRWRKATNCFAPTSNRTPAPVPSDFRDRAPRFTNRMLAEHYQVGHKVITRWRKETGFTGPLVATRQSHALPKQLVPSIPAGRASEAAQFLRKTHAPVYHRIVEGKQYEGLYCVGTRVMSEAELIEYAESKGFEAISSIYHSRFD